MKFNYKFQNLLGTVYRKGDILFTNDGNCVISPVGNRITIYNLVQNKSRTLPTESSFNYTALDVSPNGSTLLAVNEQGLAQMISLQTCNIVHSYKFKQEVSAVKFSPDGKYFAACCADMVFVMTAPCHFTGEYRSFVLKRVFRKARDDVTCLDWSSCSQLLAVGSKDTTTKIYTVDYLDNLSMYSLGGHTDKIVGVFFEKKSLDLITVSRNGQVCLWEASIDMDELKKSEVQISHRKRRKMAEESDKEDDIDDKDIVEKEKEYESDEDELTEKSETSTCENRLQYKKLGRHYIGDAIRSAHHKVKVSAAQYHKETKMLVTSFTNGIFFLHEMPDVNLIHTLSVSEHGISSVAISRPGDWIAFGCPHIGQLLVWEWQSEQYVMKQQGHSLDMTCLAYSPDGLYIVTGGYDGKVKVWNTTTGFCFVTFSEHTSTVTSIVFSANKRFLVSSSLDGTVRCYDLIRYRNFRTLTSPSLVQFSCVALDSSSELCAAGGQDVFEIFLWSVKFGKLLEVLGGHEAPVSSLSFSPTLSSTRLASASWDKTVRLWNCIESSSESETIQLNSDALQVVFRPDGEEIAVSTLDGNITCFDATTCDQTASIEGRVDLGSGRGDKDLITAKKMLKTKAFTTICYSADGTCILGAGNSKHVCLYSIKESILIRKFVITQNKSLDAVNDFINRRLMTEFGNMALVEDRTALEGGDVAIRLPGVKEGDMADRRVKPEVRVHCVRFSPTGENFACAATEGLFVYSQNAGMDGTFRPYRLEADSTPATVKRRLADRSWGAAIVGALQLNEHGLIRECVEAVPSTDKSLIVESSTLATPLIEGKKTGEKIKDHIQEVLIEYGLEEKKAVMVTDSGSNVKKAVYLLNMGSHLCLGHGLHNLVVQDGIKNTLEIDKIVKKCKKIVKCLRFRLPELEKDADEEQKRLLMEVEEAAEFVEYDELDPVGDDDMREEQQHEDLHVSSIKTATPTRWHSVVVMLESINNRANRNPIHKLLGKLNKSELKIDDYEWKSIGDLIKVLNKFKDAVKIMRASKLITINVALVFRCEIEEALNQIGDDECLLMVTMKHNMLAKLDHRFPVNKLTIAATLLDCRFQGLHAVDRYLEKCRETRVSFLSAYVRENIKEGDLPKSRENEQSYSSSIVGPSISSSDILLAMSQKYTIAGSTTADDPVESECWKYFGGCDPKDMADGNLLRYWQKKKNSSPRLFALVRVTMRVPATITPSERVFSVAGLTITAKRSRLSAVELTVTSLEEDYTDRLLTTISRLLEESPHIEHLMLWTKSIVTLKHCKFPQSVLLALEKALTVKYSQLSKICDFNKYTIRCIKTVGEIASKRELEMEVDAASSGRGSLSDSD